MVDVSPLTSIFLPVLDSPAISPSPLLKSLTIGTSSLPAFALIPPTPPLHPYFERDESITAHLSSAGLRTPCSPRPDTPHPFASFTFPPKSTAPSTSADVSPPSPPTTLVTQKTVRPLELNEARQVSLLLSKRLPPILNTATTLTGENMKIMRPSIVLAEELHAAGVRWDKMRRIMGFHVRAMQVEVGRLRAVSSGERSVLCVLRRAVGLME